MVGANPRCHTRGCANPAALPNGFVRRVDGFCVGVSRWRLIAIASALLPLSFALSECSKAPGPASLAANAQVGAGDTFEDRFPKPEFRDRFPTASESLEQHQMSDFAPRRTVQTQTYRVASLEPTLPFQHEPTKEDLTTLVSMKSSAFPYYGNNPASDAPFLNITEGDRRGHRSYSGHVYWQDQTYNDSRVLMHIPENFDVRKPGVIVVFFHGMAQRWNAMCATGNWCRSRLPIPASTPCCWRRRWRSTPPIPAPASSGSQVDSSASWKNR
jgi:hypothetical protein